VVTIAARAVRSSRRVLLPATEAALEAPGPDMSRLTCRTAGESHGRAILAFVEGLPAGLTIDVEMINSELRRRQGGRGRSARMGIEEDRVEVLSGVRRGRTIGSPVVLQVVNRDFRIDAAPEVNRPRPGHADLAGSIKWLTTDCRDVLERASARETVARVAAGALVRNLLAEFGIVCVGFVVEIGGVRAQVPEDLSPVDLCRAREANEVYTPDARAAERMVAAIRQAEQDGDTLGGVVEVRAFGVPAGLGSCASWQQKLDGALMRAVGSVQGIKGVEIGLGFECARLRGSQVHDAIYFDPGQRFTGNFGFTRRTNRAGGLEGGMTNGMPVILRAAMKPIATLPGGLASVDLRTLSPQRGDYERSDVCAVPAASVIVENVVAFELARALLDKFGGDTLHEVKVAYEQFCAAVRGLARPVD
jgi:chorismate synthase